MAMLALEGPRDESRRECTARLDRVRDHLVEAVTELAKARIYVPGIRTYTVSAVMAAQGDLHRERSRLYGLASSLLWNNHAHLPARVQRVDEKQEAELERMTRGFQRQRRISGLLRYKWLGAAAGLAALAPVIGFVATFVGVAAIATWQFAAARAGGQVPALSEAC